MDFALAQSLRHRRSLLELPLAAEVEARYAQMAEESLAAQRHIEDTDHISFETYRQQYPALALMSVEQFQSNF